MSVNLKKIFQRNQNHPWQTIGDNTVILSTKGMMSHELENIGSYVWENLDGQKSLEQLSLALCEEYDVTPTEAQQDLLELISELQKEELVDCLA